MRYAFLLLTAFLAFASLPASAETTPAAATTTTITTTTAAPAATFTDAQRAAIGDIIKDYITKQHPEVLMQAAQELQKRDMATAETKSQEGILKNKDKIYNDPNSAVGGDPKGDVTVVEFYDYQCGYCKMAEASIEKLLQEDKKVRFIYKEYPILGPASVEASKASFASMRQNKFQKFHDTLINKKDHVTADLIAQSAKEAGLDTDKLKKDMADPAIQKLIEESISLGQDIGVRGTPMFIINDNVYPGAMQYDELKKAVDEAHAKAKKS